MPSTPLLIAVSLIAVLLLGVFWYRSRYGKDRLHRLFDVISFQHRDGMVIPNGDDGEIMIDHLLLTAKGLLVLHIKDVQGSVFGSDKMQEWAVIAPERRYTFSNPQPALYDRVAAVRQIVKDVPVEGRILFLDGADFSKGVPGMVATIDELEREFAELDNAAAGRKIDAFKPYWDQLQDVARSN